MARWCNRLIPGVAATMLLLGTGAVTNAVSDEEAVLIPGATVFKQINPLYPTIAATYPSIGTHFRDDDDPQVVQYSQNALSSNRAIQDGVRQALLAVGSQPAGKVVVIGESMGSMVAWRVAQEVAKDDPSYSRDVRFVLIAPPEAGVAEYFPEGTYIPILNYRITRIPAEMPYPTIIVIGEYDGWSDPPDRPWNLIASANALLGTVFVHGPPMFTANPADVPAENRSVSPNGTVTTMLVSTENLPLTQFARMVGVPDAVVDKVDQVLRPIVDAGYRRHDQPGDPRPYLSEGRIVRDVQWQPEVADRRVERAEPRDLRSAIRAERRQQIDADVNGRMARGVRQLKQKNAEQHELRGAIRVEHRQQIRSDVNDRVVQGVQKLKQKRAERQAARADR